MTARCTVCGRYWNISVQKQIPRSGYTCPYCATRDRPIRTGIIKNERRIESAT